MTRPEDDLTEWQTFSMASITIPREVEQGILHAVMHPKQFQAYCARCPSWVFLETVWSVKQQPGDEDMQQVQ